MPGGAGELFEFLGWDGFDDLDGFADGTLCVDLQEEMDVVCGDADLFEDSRSRGGCGFCCDYFKETVLKGNILFIYF